MSSCNLIIDIYQFCRLVFLFVAVFYVRFSYKHLGRFPFDQNFRNCRSETEWNGKNSGKSFRKFRNTLWVYPLQRNFRNYRKCCVPFARNLGFSLSTERELTWAFAKMATVAAYQCSACGFVANDSFCSINAAVYFPQPATVCYSCSYVFFSILIELRYLRLSLVSSSVPAVLPCC